MSKSKNTKLLIGLISMAVILIAAIAILNVLENRSTETPGGTTEASDETTEASDESTALHIIGNSEMDEILNDDSGVGTFVYVGRPTCPFCVEFEPILVGVLEEKGQELLYFETDLANLEDSDRRVQIMEHLGLAGVPAIVYVVNVKRQMP